MHFERRYPSGQFSHPLWVMKFLFILFVCLFFVGGVVTTDII